MSQGNHELGNHSLTHVKMPGMSNKAIISEIQGAESGIERITGKKTRLFRAPFGEYDSNVVSAAKKLGYNIIQWDVNSLDWQGESSAAIYDRVILKASNGSLILFHNSMGTPDAVLKIIEKLRNDGYMFVTVSELMLTENYYIDNTGRQRSLK
jgi:peptidoglycan/xylan/chitin deacetylase (PgdA/CDA1 family)